MRANDDIVRARISAALRDTEQYFAKGQIFLGGVGFLIVVVGLARSLGWLALFGGVFFGALIGLLESVRRRTRNRPIRGMLSNEPERVTAIEHYTTSASSGAFPSH